MLVTNFPEHADLILPAPAKLNLFLHIIGRRSNGYHELQTVFQFLDYADELAFNLRDDGEIVLHTPFENVAHDDNLIVKAAHLLKQSTSNNKGVDIWINKKLPMGGGIGGGSSNAATTLLALNKLWQLDYSLDTLAILGIALGADVPVFIKGEAAFAEGIGEKLQPISPLEYWYLVARPKVNISTASIFNEPSLSRNTAIISYQQAQTIEGHNDCQPIVLSKYPEVANVYKCMQGLGIPKLTGTGACLFCSFPSKEKAEHAQQRLAEQSISSFIAKAANRSLLHRTLSLKKGD